MHAFQRQIDTDREGPAADGKQRAIVTQVAARGAEPCKDGAQDVELTSWAPAQAEWPSRHAVSGGSRTVSTGGPTGWVLVHARQISGRAARTSAGRRLRADHRRAPCSAAPPRALAPSAAASGPALPRARKAPNDPPGRSARRPV